MKLTLKMWFLIFVLIAALIAINPTGYFKEGVLVKSVVSDSSASISGLTSGSIINSINEDKISNLNDYNNIISEISKGFQPADWTIKASGKEFRYSSLTLDFEINNNLTIISAGETAKNSSLMENMVLESINNEIVKNLDDFDSIKLSLEPKTKLTLNTNKGEFIFLASSIDFTVSEIPKTNIKMGLDLQGGAKALVKPERKLSQSEMNDLITISKERFNVYGIADIVIRPATDLSGNNYMLVEVAGATPAELKELIGKQGKFDAKIGNDTVFIGGKKHITSVCRNDATCAGIKECGKSSEGYACQFQFTIYLSQEAAETQANITSTLQINTTSSGNKILSKNLDLYLDDKLVDTLQIDSDLKGKVATQISINGPGVGATELDAFQNAEANMKKLQTVLITGSLPFKLEIVKLDSISPLLGNEFFTNIAYAAIAALLAVGLIVFIRYKKLMYTIPVIITVSLEIFVILGFASLIKWNLDLASIAGIIAAIGTGVDDQIVIIDESKSKAQYSIKEKIKRAFKIIIGAFATSLVSLVPLWWAGAGIMRGFALTTIAGICIGVLITRPAFADVINQITKE